MYSYPVTVWFRYGSANQKDYLSENILASSEEEAREKALLLRPNIFKVIIDRPEIQKLEKLRTLKMLIQDYQKERDKLNQSEWGADTALENYGRGLELQNKIKETEREFDKTLFSYDNI